MSPTPHSRTLRHTAVFAFTLLFIEFLDEFVYGAGEAAWPLIRDDLALSYAQIGLLISVPSVVSSVVEPFLGILADKWRRRVLVLGGGVMFALALLLTALSRGFPILLASFVLFYPASGAFVSLSQATLMDIDPTRHEQNMARWTFAGSLGVVVGSLALGAAAALGLGWRGLYLFLAGFTLLPLVAAFRFRFTDGQRVPEKLSPKLVGKGFIDALRALRRVEVLRWLTLLQFSDLMLDVLLGFLALYFVDVVDVSKAMSALAVTVWTVVGLASNLLLIPLLERVRGLGYLRWSAAVELVLFPAFLLVPGMWAKLVLLGLLGFFSAGWYSILQARLYAAMPGQSGIALTVSNLIGLVGGLIPLGLGLVAERFSLAVAMWLLLLGPVALLLGIPGRGVEASG